MERPIAWLSKRRVFMPIVTGTGRQIAPNKIHLAGPQALYASFMGQDP